MEKSLFSNFVEKYFHKIIGVITEKWNGKKNEETLLHKTMLREEYSPDLSWNSTELNHSVVAADVVSLDSSLPLKRRGSLSIASGKLTKLGVKFRKGEKELSDINVMIARGTDEATVASKIFDDTSKGVRAIDIRKEILFEQGLSTGYSLVTDENNQGTGIRVSFGYKASNTAHANSPWNDGGANIDDVRKIFDLAQENSDTINHVYISKKYFNLLRVSEQGKQLAANYAGRIITDISLLPVPTRSAFLEALADEFSATFHVVDSTFKIENLDGTTTSVRPWAEGNIVGVPDEIVGRLVYGTLAEETNPVAGVAYEKSGTHTLVSKYSKTDPLEEFTAAQALCLPVIDGADSIYILHADQMAPLSFGDTVQPIYIETSGASKKVNLHYDGGDASKLSVKSKPEYITIALAKDKLTISATENTTGNYRNGFVVITDGEYEATLTFSQNK